MKNLLSKLSAFIFIMFGSIVSTFGQPTPPDPGAGPTGSDPVLGCGVGDGTMILIAIAVSYGIYLYLQMKRAKNLA